MALHDNVSLPGNVEQGFARKIKFNVSRINHHNGRSQRVVKGQSPHYAFTATYPMLDFKQNVDVLGFYVARRAWQKSFNFTDQTDFSTAADDTGIPAAGNITMTLSGGRYYIDKPYTDGTRTILRRIVKPYGFISNNPGGWTLYPDGGFVFDSITVPTVTCGSYFYVPVKFSPMIDLLETSINGSNNTQVTVELVEVPAGEFSSPVLGSRETFGIDPLESSHPPGDEDAPDGGPPIEHDNTQPPEVPPPADCEEAQAVVGPNLRATPLDGNLWGRSWIDMVWRSPNNEGYNDVTGHYWMFDLNDGYETGYLAVNCATDFETGQIFVTMQIRELSYIGSSQTVELAALKTTTFIINYMGMPWLRFIIS